MFGKNETLDREYYWRATKTSAIRIELIEQRTTTLKVGEKSENKNLPYPGLEKLYVYSCTV
jgi:hypothetical protein